MNQFTLTLSFLFFAWSMFGQSSTDIRFIEASTGKANSCYDLQLEYTGEDASLASQNYRIFYSSGTMKFIQEQTEIYLPKDQYTFNIVQHNEGVDASGIGGLSFEDNLGFINATVIFNDPRAEGFVLSQSKQWSSILQLCFDSLDTDVESQIVLARQDVSSSYGRAFVELSLVDEKGAINSLEIDKYFDYNRK